MIRIALLALTTNVISRREFNIQNKTFKILLACVLIVAVAGVLGCCCASTSSNTDSPSSSYSSSKAPTTPPTTKPTSTPKPTATPKPLAGYDLYSTWDKEKIKSSAEQVNWEDFIRRPDNYKDKLIMLKGDVVFGNKDWRDRTYFTMNVNPTFFNGHDYSSSDSYNPQYVEFDYNTEGIIDGDELDMYGVYEGDKTFTDYPKINGVYCVLYN